MIYCVCTFQVPGYPDWFNLKYSGDRSIYTYELLEDYIKGDLKLLVWLLLIRLKIWTTRCLYFVCFDNWGHVLSIFYGKENGSKIDRNETKMDKFQKIIKNREFIFEYFNLHFHNLLSKTFSKMYIYHVFVEELDIALISLN